jgi:hypothetical protein
LVSPYSFQVLRLEQPPLIEPAFREHADTDHFSGTWEPMGPLFDPFDGNAPYEFNLSKFPLHLIDNQVDLGVAVDGHSSMSPFPLYEASVQGVVKDEKRLHN